MKAQTPVIISAAVEGITDEAVARKLIALAGGQSGAVYAKNGKPALLEKINGYNNAAHFAPWVVLIDLDDDAECAPLIREKWLAVPAPHLCLRIVVRAVEAWLMADGQKLAQFLRVAQGIVPAQPEKLARPKDALVDLARRSRSRDIRLDMVPREGCGRRSGPAYTSRLIEYIQKDWRPQVAAERADSLRRAISCLEELVTTF